MDEQYRRYFDAMPCFLTVQDRNFRIIDANRSFRDNFGDYEDRFCYQVYKQRPEKCEDCPVERSFRNGEAYSSEELVRTLDGREVWVIVNTRPIRNADGEIEAVMEMSTDVTDIKLLQKQLADSQKRYRQLFEEVPCYISIQDRDLRIVDANRLHRETFGTSYGSKCYEVYKHRTRACQPCPVQETFRDGEVRTHEEVVTSPDDESINVLVCTAPVRDADGNIDTVIEMSTDITRIRELQDKLASVGLLIGSISHGIKGMLNGLDGGIYLVNSGLKKNDRTRIDRGWEIAERNVDRIRTMVMDILYYAKDREVDWQTISAGDLMKDVCRIIHDKAAVHDIEVACSLDSSAGEFEADPQAVRSLLTNLVENALDACRIDTAEDNHKITATARGEKDHVVFEITDNGIGMDRETREKAFTLFFSSKGAGGTGLGLFIAHKIARAHGGNIVIESEEKKGTRMIVTMRRTRPEETENAINAGTDSGEGQSDG